MNVLMIHKIVKFKQINTHKSTTLCHSHRKIFFYCFLTLPQFQSFQLFSVSSVFHINANTFYTLYTHLKVWKGSSNPYLFDKHSVFRGLNMLFINSASKYALIILTLELVYATLPSLFEIWTLKNNIFLYFQSLVYLGSFTSSKMQKVCWFQNLWLSTVWVLHNHQVFRGASRIRAGQGIWVLRDGMSFHFRPLLGIFGAKGLFKEIFLFEGRECIPRSPSIDLRH